MIESFLKRGKKKTIALSSHSTETLMGFTIRGKSNGSPTKHTYSTAASCQMGVLILLHVTAVMSKPRTSEIQTLGVVMSLSPNAIKFGVLSQAKLQVCD